MVYISIRRTSILRMNLFDVSFTLSLFSPLNYSTVNTSCFSQFRQQANTLYSISLKEKCFPSAPDLVLTAHVAADTQCMGTIEINYIGIP